MVLTHLSQKNNQPHIAESTVLYYIEEIFSGDLTISTQDGPEFSHYIGTDRGHHEGLQAPQAMTVKAALEGQGINATDRCDKT